MPGVEIRDAGPADLDGLTALEHRTFSTDRLSRRSFRRLIGRRTARLRVAAERGDKGDVVVHGYHLILLRKGSCVARLYSIAVDRRFRGRGLGARLLADAETVAAGAGRQSLRLEVREGNRRAQSLYAGRGYTLIGRYEGYYEDGAAALRHEKLLARRRSSRSSGPGD